MKKGAGMAPREQWGKTRELFRADSRGHEELMGKKAGSLLNLRFFLQYDETFKDMTVSGTVQMLPRSL